MKLWRAGHTRPAAVFAGTTGKAVLAITGIALMGQLRYSPVSPHCLLNTKVDRSYHFWSHLLCLHLGGSIYCVPGTILRSLLTYSSRLLLFSCTVVSDSLRPHGLLACQAPLSMEFSRQEYWTALPFPSPEDLPDPGIEPTSPALQTVSCVTGGFFLTEPLYIPKNDR